jgi:hypothetical protein
MWRYTKRYVLTPDSKTKVALSVFMLGVGIALIPVTGGLSAAAAVGVAAGMIVGNKAVEKGVGWIEGLYDERILADKNDHDDARRVRIRRNEDHSKEVASHFVSTLKNFERIKRFRPTAEKGLKDIKDCDALLEYMWAGFKLHHHARKTVDYARPVLDVCETVYANLHHWEKFWDDNIKRALDAVNAFVKTGKHAHDKSCGTFARKPKGDLVVARNKNSTTSISKHLSDHCYGPTSHKGEGLGKANSPIDLKVKGRKTKGEFEQLRDRINERGDA